MGGREGLRAKLSRAMRHFVDRGSPDEGGMVMEEAGGHGDGVEVVLGEMFDDAGAGMVLVVVLDFLRGERTDEGDFAMKVVGVGGSIAWEGAACL